MVKAKTRIPPFNTQHLESIASILADTTEGLTGAQIGHLLQRFHKVHTHARAHTVGRSA